MAEEDLAYDFALSIASDADALPLSMVAVAQSPDGVAQRQRLAVSQR
jgi:hypothetical protein